MLILNLVKKKINTTVYLFMINIYRKYIFSVNKYTYLSLYYTGIYIYLQTENCSCKYIRCLIIILCYTHEYIYIYRIYLQGNFSQHDILNHEGPCYSTVRLYDPYNNSIAVRETGVSRHHGGTNESPLKTPRTITAFLY